MNNSRTNEPVHARQAPFGCVQHPIDFQVRGQQVCGPRSATATNKGTNQCSCELRAIHISMSFVLQHVFCAIFKMFKFNSTIFLLPVV